MSTHHAKISWARGSREFTYESYGRDHVWRFPGGASVEASAAPAYRGSPERVDPEEAFVAALSSCHMLTFLAFAAHEGYVVDRYEDEAEGSLERGGDGKLAITRVVLRPRVVLAPGSVVPSDELERLHHRSHDHCFIANSVTTSVAVAPRD